MSIKLKDIINTIWRYKRAYRNWMKVLFIMAIKRGASHHENINIKVVVRNGESLVVPYGWASIYSRLINIKNLKISEIKLIPNGISFKYNGLPITIDPAIFSDPDSVFFHEDYKFLEVKNKDVIDVGMNIGDSSIYFSINGAKRVIGLEPYPYSFSFAEKNIKLNNIKNIILINAGYGNDSKITISENISSSGSNLVVSSIGKEISIYSLKSLIDKYNIRNGVLKMDCEGCEYALLNEDDEVFNNIWMIQIEYHYGCENLVNKLKSVGFDVKYTKPKQSYNSYAENPNMEVGYIYAKRAT
ncbi:FkbM family methyltransferase [Ferroplasma sp.]|jgi:FkbM family methyltransferase|uniref:FkbM family methyltransferase n=1 Tax=Ferroplasma sp. TaxID=2591003 RepID=UPI0026203129|nr:FkbM family methyltransferase [Ferroplasma sp.]